MKTFKQYISENNQYYDSNILHDILHRSLTNFHKSNPKTPKTKEQRKRDRDNRIEKYKTAKVLSPSLTTLHPQFTIEANGNKRTYTWNSWSDATRSLLHSMDFQKFTEVENNHSDVVNQFKDQHKTLISQLIGRHPIKTEEQNPNLSSIRQIINMLKNTHGQSLDEINNIQFSRLLDKSKNELEYKYQLANKIPVEKGTSHELFSISENDPNFNKKLDQSIIQHNQLVVKHDHPLGFFLNGGYRQNREKNSRGGGFYRPKSVSENGVDVTSKYFE